MGCHHCSCSHLIGMLFSCESLNSLKNRKVNQDETDPAELFKLAAFSYLESDGRAATVYFERALATGELSARQAQYAQASIDRLENPDQYGESLGVMIIDLSAGGSFEQAGLKVGDVIVALEKEVTNEPMDIASALAKAGTVKIPLTIVRDGQKQIVTVQGDQPAAAKLTQLIVLNAIQL
jgi:S1-C subfamily serine protease